MSTDALEQRSQDLEDVRHTLRKHLDKCLGIKRTPFFTIQHETDLIFTPSEEKAMQRQLQASHGHLYELDVTFIPKRRRRRQSIVVIVIKAKRRRMPLPL